ncbi:MAG TPA: AAA family ATPase [Methylomirabilota bacterium]|nr:AAA family ATPase [Methylomirabilota bacterium]
MGGVPLVDAGPELIEREQESAVLDALVDRLRDGGGAVVVRGEAGIGKSALLQRVRRQAEAQGARPLATVGVESEAELPFAGLHQLLRPVIGALAQQPESQRQALEAALGLGVDDKPDPYRVAVAAFQLICEVADSVPLVLIVDDAHWLDRSTLSVIAFIGRRLEAEHVALVAAIRSGQSTPLDDARLPTLDLERLSASAAARLLDRNAPELHPVLRARVLAESSGNPLALVELARSMGRSGEQLSPPPTTLTARLDRAFASRLGDLAPGTRPALLAAALDSRASLDEIARSSGTGVESLQPAVEADLVEIADDGVRFRHPLIRSAVRQAASAQQVLEMYRALAEVVADPERQLWHRAMAARGPDENIASALEQHARLAAARGAVTVAGAAFERAAALTADPRSKGARLVAAAEIAYELGLVESARRLVDDATSFDLSGRDEARLAWFRQIISGSVWFESGAARTFVTIAEHLRDGGDSDMALRSLVPIAHRCWWTRTKTRTREYLVEAALAMGMADDDPRVLAVVGLAHPEEAGPTILKRISGMRLHETTDPLAAMYVGIAAEKAGDFATGVRFLTSAIDGLREQVRLVPLTQALVHYAWAATYAGEWPAAAAAAYEAAGLARDTSQPQYGLTGELVGALTMAMRGTEPDLESLVAEPERALLAMKGGPLLATAHLARAAAAIGEGRHEDAFRHLWPVFDETDSAFHRFMRWPALLDLVEAAAGSGRTSRLTDVIADLEAISLHSEPPILRLNLACARPILATDDQAEALFAAALAQDLVGYPFLRARTLFSFGRWLRRRRRSAESRSPLRESVALFDAQGATAWSRRARQELRATGEKVGRRAPDPRDRLTTQELQIAQLAAEGLSNRQIAERLFLSPRTIGGHLYRIFPKLEITARAQLRDAFADRVGD